MLLSENVTGGGALAFYTLLGHVNRFLLADAFPILNHKTFIASNSPIQRQGSTIQMNQTARFSAKVPPYR
ncbi:hypothetical protein TNCV_2305721 [Trichonephila clavipes]|nr:hypothetical protein TNCV_2305721 [Trichonephila clavipes]